MKDISFFPLITFILFLGLLASLGVQFIRRQALQLGLIDEPNHRSSHTIPTPRGGGLAIVIVTGVAWIGIGSGYFRLRWLEIVGYALPALFIAGISWIDDLRSLPNKIRFFSHLLAAGCAIFVFGYFQSVGLFYGWEIHLGKWGIALTLFWIVGLTNIYNFMDGIDGIAGTQAIVAGVSWGIIGILYQQPIIVLLALALAATSSGFLFHNWSPARIFMGDVGSAFLGYSLAVIPLMLRGELQGFALLLSVLPLWIFIADATFTIIRRALHGENIFTPHRSHLYQRLVIAGCSHQGITLLYGSLSLLGGVGAVIHAYQPVNNSVGVVIFFICMVSFILLHQLVLYLERSGKAPLIRRKQIDSNC